MLHVTFPPPDACKKSSWLEGLVSHLEDDQFWLQRNPDEVSAISAKLDEAEVQETSEEVTEGVAVVAFWQDGFYRAEVKEVREDGCLLLHFVDWGNCDLVTRAEVRPVTPEELLEPVQAVRYWWPGIRIC